MGMLLRRHLLARGHAEEANPKPTAEAPTSVIEVKDEAPKASKAHAPAKAPKAEKA